MRNFGFLSTIFSFIDTKNTPIINREGKYLKKHLRVNFIRLLFSFIGLLLFGYVLIKVYEVPVYYTKIDMVSKNCKPYEYGKLNIKLCRNYDRSDKSSLIPDSNTIIGENGKIFHPGVSICGRFVPTYYSSNDKADRINRIKTKADSIMMSETGRTIDNPQMVYISILTSSRQYILPSSKEHYYSSSISRTDSLPHADIRIDISTLIKDLKFKPEDIVNIGIKYKVKDMFWYASGERRRSDNGYLINYYAMASEKDETFPVWLSYMTRSFLRPSVWLTAEDISKLVEVIELGHSEREHDEYAGAWAFTNSITIDYVGPSEFSENIIPEPDEKTLTYIRYTDKDKIEKIGREGLRYHVRFPDMENIQEARIFILSGLLTGLGALFLRYLWRVFIDIHKMVNAHIPPRCKIRKWWGVCVLVIMALIVYYFYMVYVESNVKPFEVTNELMR